MIYDILEVFKDAYKKEGDKLILGNYSLKEGLYCKINKDETINYFIVKKKNKELSFTDINGGLDSEMFEWFKERDYYSNYLNSNKAIDPPKKMIHNNNYLTLFMKIDNIKSENLNYIEEKLFKSLKGFKSFNKPKEIEILKNYNQYILNDERKKDISIKYKILSTIFEEIISIKEEKGIKNYVKIFFDEDIEKYKDESKIYFAIKIFNDIKYSKVLDETIYGLSNSNMGLNAKKPYLESKTKKFTIPFMITDENALIIKKFFDWLKFQGYNEHYPLDKNEEHLFMNKHSKNDEAIIDDFDYIPNQIDKLKESIYFKNHLMLKNGKKLIEDDTIDYLYELEEIVHEIFYNNQLKNNYFNEVYKKLDKSFQNLIYITRASMVNYFKKYNEKTFYQVIKKYGSDFVILHLKRDNLFKAGLSLNLKLSLLAHKGEKVMNIKEMQTNMLNRLIDSDYKELSAEEFFYLAGQVVKYLLNHSEAFEKKGDMLEPFLRANNAQKIKKNIEVVYFKYKHAVSLNYVKFNNAISLVMSYSSEDKLSHNMDNFLIGVLSDNIFYVKKEE